VPREILKKSGASALETTIRSLLPKMSTQLDRIENDLRLMDVKIDSLRQEMYDRFEQTRDVINELGQRMSRVEGQLDLVVKTADRQSTKMDQWIERLVRLEMTRGARKGKRAS
jgi:hypothetical protein